jgi:hypothetical protein
MGLVEEDVSNMYRHVQTAATDSDPCSHAEDVAINLYQG